MTREEEIRSAGKRICWSSESTIASKKGAEWADDNPKSPWISVKKDLPCSHIDMINVFVKNVEWRTDRVLAMFDDGVMIVTYMYKLGSRSWNWNVTDRITHWMPIPKLEEE